LSSFSLSYYPHHLDLHSFPTRRSSDLRLAHLHLDGEDFRQRLLGRELVRHDPARGLAGRAEAAALVEVADLHDHAVRLVGQVVRSEEHTSELQSLAYLVCRLLLEKKKR